MAKAVARGSRCNMNLGLTFIALVVMTLAVYALVNGFAFHLQAVQTGSQSYGMVLIWYFVGFLLMFAGKMVKWKAHGNCPVHKM